MYPVKILCTNTADQGSLRYLPCLPRYLPRYVPNPSLQEQDCGPASYPKTISHDVDGRRSLLVLLHTFMESARSAILRLATVSLAQGCPRDNERKLLSPFSVQPTRSTR